MQQRETLERAARVWQHQGATQVLTEMEPALRDGADDDARDWLKREQPRAAALVADCEKWLEKDSGREYAERELCVRMWMLDGGRKVLQDQLDAKEERAALQHVEETIQALQCTARLLVIANCEDAAARLSAVEELTDVIDSSLEELDDEQALLCALHQARSDESSCEELCYNALSQSEAPNLPPLTLMPRQVAAECVLPSAAQPDAPWFLAPDKTWLISCKATPPGDTESPAPPGDDSAPGPWFRHSSGKWHQTVSESAVGYEGPWYRADSGGWFKGEPAVAPVPPPLPVAQSTFGSYCGRWVDQQLQLGGVQPHLDKLAIATRRVDCLSELSAARMPADSAAPGPSPVLPTCCLNPAACLLPAS